MAQTKAKKKEILESKILRGLRLKAYKTFKDEDVPFVMNKLTGKDRARLANAIRKRDYFTAGKIVISASDAWAQLQAEEQYRLLSPGGKISLANLGELVL